MKAGDYFDFQFELSRMVDEQMRAINENKEKYIEAWLAETGLLPTQCQLVERWKADGSVVFTIEALDKVKI